MIVNITDTAVSTAIVIALLAVGLVLTLVRKKDKSLLPITVTQELKGFAILAILFAHTGYYLVSDHQFLQPLSVLAGVGVDIFLFVSGYGLTASALSKEQSILRFYKSKLPKIYVPMWLSLGALFGLSALVLHVGYSAQYMTQSLAGLFTSAQIYQDLNSPLWYFTFILGYYLVFPLFFLKKYPWLSAMALFAISYIVFQANPEFLRGVMDIYKLHLAAFPLGMIGAWLVNGYLARFKSSDLKWLRWLILPVLIIIIGYTAVHSGVGQEWYVEENISLVTMLAVVLLFVLKPIQSNLLIAFGLYSYEIYLLQWPLGYWFGAFPANMPAWIGMIIYSGILLVLCLILKKASEFVMKAILNRSDGTRYVALRT